jgi:hypothetical protein
MGFIAFILELKSACLVVIGQAKTNNKTDVILNFQDEKRNADMGTG